MNTDIPILYILMRTDLDSMNAGKAVAQGAHAANQFAYYVNRELETYKEWIKSTMCGFGTTIVLSVSNQEIDDIVNKYYNSGPEPKVAGIVHDPSYPIKDGDTVHHLPLDTCAYIFGLKSELEPVLSTLNLMK